MDRELYCLNRARGNTRAGRPVARQLSITKPQKYIQLELLRLPSLMVGYVVAKGRVEMPHHFG
jgi:hypothetical protein